MTIVSTSTVLGFFFLANALYIAVLALPHSQMPDVTLQCYSCTTTEHEFINEAQESCTDPSSSESNNVTLIVKCVNQLCMQLSGHSEPHGHRLQRGCGDESVTQPGCKDLPEKGNESQRYACYCATDKCNSEPGLVVERLEQMKVPVSSGEEDNHNVNSASSFYLIMSGQINVASYFVLLLTLN